MSELIFVKLGGSVITDKRRAATARLQVIARLAREVREACAARPDLKLVLGHGSGSFGHVEGQKYHVHQGLGDDESWWGYAATAAAAARLNRLVTDVFLAARVPVLSLQPSASAFCEGGQLVTMEIEPVRQALRHGLIPLVYGDVAFDRIQGCAIVSTEAILAYLARELHPTRMVMVGVVNGVYDRDPLQDPAARRIPCITPATLAGTGIKLGSSYGTDITGGMLTKVRTMMSLVAAGDVRRVHLISGLREGALSRVLQGLDADEGTVIEAQYAGRNR